MSNKQRHEKKRQDRKDQAKNRVMIRRQKLRALAKEARDIEKMKRRYRVKEAPIRNQGSGNAPEPAMTDQMPVDDARKTEWIKKRLEHNMKILEALEEEMAREEKEREAVHASLEAQGATTLREKMDLMARTAMERTGQDQEDKARLKITGKAKVEAIPNQE